MCIQLKLHNMKSRVKCLITGFVFGMFFLMALLTSIGCKTQKQVSNTQTAQSSLNTDYNTEYKKYSEVRAYGDTLTGSSYLSAFFDKTSPRDIDSINAESTGIQMGIQLTAQRDTQGHVTGLHLKYLGIAKPTTKTNTHEVQQANVKQTAKTDIKKTETSVTSTQKGFSVPSWVWALVIVIILIMVTLAGWQFIQKLKTLTNIPQWLKKIL
jgi:hypothetical protein